MNGDDFHKEVLTSLTRIETPNFTLRRRGKKQVEEFCRLFRKAQEGALRSKDRYAANAPVIPFMERLTPAQRRKFRAGMARLRRQFEKQLRDAARFEKRSRKARIMVGQNAGADAGEAAFRAYQRETPANALGVFYEAQRRGSCFGDEGADSMKPLVRNSFRVLVACEFSGEVRRAFRQRGYDAWSCDLLPAEDNSPFHWQEDVRFCLEQFEWDLMIAHPPCTHLAVSGARWFKDKVQEQAAALDFVRLLLAAPVPHIALENPVSVISSRVRKPDQIIQPWQHGHGETKATCLWLVNLPPLVPSNVVEGREGRVWKMPPSPDRWRERSRTFPGVAAAMAAQWGEFCIANARLDQQEEAR